MAKKVKFTLEMKGGVQARTLEDLQEHFDMEKVVGYFTDGRLQTWLEERYYEDEAEAVSNLSKSTPDFHKKLCEALGVVVSKDALPAIDIEEVERRKQRLEYLRQYTADKDIMDKVDFVAFNQEELGNLLSDGVSEIILCNGSFRIPLKQKNKKYIGVGRVEVVIKSREKVDFSALGITFVNVKFDLEYEKLENTTDEQIYEMAIAEEDDEKAIALLKKAIEMGNADAMCALGKRYEEGKGVSQDYNIAIEWFQKSIDFGNAYAMDKMGDMFYHGTGVGQDYVKAVEWYKKSAYLGNITGLIDLGVCYYCGEGIERNDEEAIKCFEKALEINCEDFDAMMWLGDIYADSSSNLYFPQKAFKLYSKAAKIDSVQAACFLGKCYWEGIGVTANIQKAIEWYSIAAINGDDDAMNSLGVIYSELVNGTDDYNERNEYRRKENEWYEKAIEKGNTWSMYNLANNYLHGRGVDRSISRAVELGERAADEGNVSAMTMLAEIYSDETSKLLNYQKVRFWLGKAVDAGNAYAMDKMGDMFYYGTGVEQDYGKAFDWYKKSAELGNYLGWRDLGISYCCGNGIEKNNKEAVKCLKKALAINCEDYRTMMWLGRIYADSESDTYSPNEAFEWYSKAAEIDSDYAACDLGKCYWDGIGVTANTQKAIEWYYKAALNGDDVAMNSLGVIYCELADGTDDYNERNEYRRKENEWYEKAIEKGNTWSMYNLAYNYLHGRGVGSSVSRAVQLGERAAGEGNISAMTMLAEIYSDKTAGRLNYQKARFWLGKAAEAGSGLAMNQLGHMFEEGIGVSKNYALAIEWYRKAVDAGNLDAMSNLGLMYEKGKGVTQNYVEAASWYKVASNQGDAIAMRHIGRLYFNGNGVPKDEELALKWWQRSADAGDETAKKWIAEVNEAKRQGKSGGCFITTAVCETFGKSDDCYELTMFRDFRDNWLALQVGGKDLIQEYYAIAPRIVSAINELPSAKSVYQRIWDDYLVKCLEQIEKGNLLACKNMYIKMVENLRKEYLD